MAVTEPGRRAALTLGPVLFNWPPEIKRDFYFRIADEAPVDRICLGEVVCSKRAAFFDPYLPEVAERLQRGGKTAIVSTLALATSVREIAALRDLIAGCELPVEANDTAALALLSGRPHIVGPFVNVYNEDTLRFLARRGAQRIALPVELPASALGALAAAAAGEGVELEVQVFGRLPLAISARCYHARAHGLHKDGCRYVCGGDPDGMAVETVDGKGFLAVNGTQTLSHGVVNLAAEVPEMCRLGITSFRLSPHSVDMVAVSRLMRSILDGCEDADAVSRRISELVSFAPCVNGFYHGGDGATFVVAGTPAR
jgi:collagenase-like PrtC family protease